MIITNVIYGVWWNRKSIFAVFLFGVRIFISSVGNGIIGRSMVSARKQNKFLFGGNIKNKRYNVTIMIRFINFLYVTIYKNGGAK